MRFFTAAFGLLGLATTALATTAGFHAITKPGMGETVKAGDVYTIEWSYSDMYEGQVTLELLGGDTQGTLTSIATLGTTDGKNGALAWAVSDSLGDLKVYGLRISLADDPNTFQYSTPFSIQGDGSKASTTASESETMTTTSAESSSTNTKHSKTKTTTTTSSSSSSSSSSSTSSTESSTSSAPSTSTTFVIVTTSRSDFTTSPLTQVTTSASETATSTSKPDSRGPISGGAIAGIAAGGVAGLAVLLGMLSMTFKLIRQRRQEAYENM